MSFLTIKCNRNFDLELNESHPALPIAALSDFDQRQQLGTGDINPKARTSPARHLVVGQTYDTLLADGRCTIHEINADGDLQVTFPDYVNPNELFTLEKEQIVVNTAKTEEAHVLEKQADGAMIQVGPLDAFSIETPDGEFITSQDFTTTMLATEEALSIVSQTVTASTTTSINHGDLGDAEHDALNSTPGCATIDDTLRTTSHLHTTSKADVVLKPNDTSEHPTVILLQALLANGIRRDFRPHRRRCASRHEQPPHRNEPSARARPTSAITFAPAFLY
jgi:hypothetical protein